MTRDERDVLITGLGLLTPLGDSARAVFDALCRGDSATGLDAPFDTDGFASRVVGCVPDSVDLAAGLRKDQTRYFRKNKKVMCRDTQLAVASSGLAIADAGLPVGEPKDKPVLPTIDHTRLGTLYGAGFIPAELDDFSAIVPACADGNGGVSLEKWGHEGLSTMFPLWMLKFLPNMLSCHVSIVWDCQGPNNAITCNEASGLLAIGESARHIARGTADLMIAGGAESKVNPSAILRQVILGNATTAHNDRPAEAHRPFDADRDGCVCAEGAGSVLLEAGDTVVGTPRGRITGFGSTAAQTLPNVPETSGAAIARSIRFALRDAGREPSDVDAVVAHGVAVPGQDVAEAAAIAELLGDVPVTASSGGMGNLGAGSGPVDLILACCMLAEGRVPPVRNCDRVADDCPINVVTGEPLDRPLQRVLVLSSAISGQACALLVENV